MKDIIKKYTNGEVTVVWQPGKCVHSTICFRRPDGLPEVFKPALRPWITMDGAPTDRIIETVKKCPSHALSYFMNKESAGHADEIKGDDITGAGDGFDVIDENEAGKGPGEKIAPEPELVVQVMKNGPLLIFGNITIKTPDGAETKRTKVTSFCRCGASKTNPYCDGTHLDIRYRG